jgi:apolipoprotein N-acyltransferase
MSAIPLDSRVGLDQTRRRIPSWLLLVLGGVFTFLAFMRFSLAAFGWVACAPFLAYLYEDGSIRRHLKLLGALFLAFLVTVSKMATPEISWLPVPFFAIPKALVTFAMLTLAGAAHRRLGLRWGILTMASVSVVLNWAQYSFTPMSSWGALAHTQLDNLPLIQLAALTGIGGITFVVALGSGLAAAAWTSGIRAVRVELLGFGMLLCAILLYGQLRLGRPAPGPWVRVGAVVSPITHQEFRAAGGNLDSLRRWDDELFARSARAAALGAKVVVWNETATLVKVEDESALASRGQAFAQKHGVLFLMAYGVVTSLQPFHDVNKYRIYLPDGTMADEYVKRHPVPVDPDAAGSRPAAVVGYLGIRWSGAICYDYGFPHVARENAADAADVALVPASDWRGVDPQHGRMALLNAVAAGLPMLRPVRDATSIATDPFGRILGSMPADGGGDKVMVIALPCERVPTLYVLTGELVPIFCLAFCGLVLLRLCRARVVLPSDPAIR